MGRSWCGFAKVSRIETMTGGVFKSVVGGGVEEGLVGSGKNYYMVQD